MPPANTHTTGLKRDINFTRKPLEEHQRRPSSYPQPQPQSVFLPSLLSSVSDLRPAKRVPALPQPGRHTLRVPAPRLGVARGPESFSRQPSASAPVPPEPCERGAEHGPGHPRTAAGPGCGGRCRAGLGRALTGRDGAGADWPGLAFTRWPGGGGS